MITVLCEKSKYIERRRAKVVVFIGSLVCWRPRNTFQHNLFIFHATPQCSPLGQLQSFHLFLNQFNFYQTLSLGPAIFFLVLVGLLVCWSLATLSNIFYLFFMLHLNAAHKDSCRASIYGQISSIFNKLSHWAPQSSSLFQLAHLCVGASQHFPTYFFYFSCCTSMWPTRTAAELPSVGTYFLFLPNSHIRPRNPLPCSGCVNYRNIGENHRK